jgi:hypothetical protein
MMSMPSSIQPSEAETSVFRCAAVIDLYHATDNLFLQTAQARRKQLEVRSFS